MGVVRYITHADVVVDPSVPVPRWPLGDLGRARVEQMLAQPWVGDIRRIVSSGETKALDTAAILATHLGLDVEQRDETGEIDRSVPGFLLPAEFELVADACFAHPDTSARGWERAVDAQARVTGALADVLADAEPATAVIGHGAVGTFWYCHLAGIPIERRWDQPGQGHYFTVVEGRPLHHWRRIDDIDGKAGGSAERSMSDR